MVFTHVSFRELVKVALANPLTTDPMPFRLGDWATFSAAEPFITGEEPISADTAHGTWIADHFAIAFEHEDFPDVPAVVASFPKSLPAKVRHGVAMTVFAMLEAAMRAPMNADVYADALKSLVDDYPANETR